MAFRNHYRGRMKRRKKYRDGVAWLEAGRRRERLLGATEETSSGSAALAKRLGEAALGEGNDSVRG